MISDLELEARAALNELTAARDCPFKLKSVEALPGLSDYWRLRFIGGPAMTVYWQPGPRPFKQVVYQAVDRYLSLRD